jgi:hypothetical protein
VTSLQACEEQNCMAVSIIALSSLPPRFSEVVNFCGDFGGDVELGGCVSSPV